MAFLRSSIRTAIYHIVVEIILQKIYFPTFVKKINFTEINNNNLPVPVLMATNRCTALFLSYGKDHPINVTVVHYLSLHTCGL